MEQNVQISILVAVLVLYLLTLGMYSSIFFPAQSQFPTALRRNYLFWMDINSDQLYRSLLNGMQATILVNSGIQCSGITNHILANQPYHLLPLKLEGLAWDWVNEKLYWTDSCQDHIEVYDPVTLYRRVLITTGTNPFAIIVDPSTG